MVADLYHSKVELCPQGRACLVCCPELLDTIYLYGELTTPKIFVCVFVYMAQCVMQYGVAGMRFLG